MLNGKQRKWLRAMAHDLQPVLQIGQHGLSDAVVLEAEQQISAHELIKVRMRGVDDGKAMSQELAAALKAELCGTIGRTAILYRPNPDAPRIVVPK
jgi:RNA-binding protein